MTRARRDPATDTEAQDRDLERLATCLGHAFARPGLLRQALTHPSALGAPGAAVESYERLEFLGDRVLALLVADMLLESFPHEAEGPLAQRLAVLVCRETLATVAQGLDLGPLLRLAKGGEGNGERHNPSILADACEAVIGALFLDGGLAAARKLVAPHWTPLIEAADEPPRDAKTALQEWAQGRGLPLPDYLETERAGPDHDPVFTIEVSLPGQAGETGQGRTKRQAEQAAAERLLARLRS